MARSAALKPEQVPADSKPTLDAFTKNIWFIPNMMASFAASPIAFNAWATFFGFLRKALDVSDADLKAVRDAGYPSSRKIRAVAENGGLCEVVVLRSSEFLGESDEKPFRSADVSEPELGRRRST